MRLLPSDPDIQTVVSRIVSGDINLQPEFQRGEVWGIPKKQRLIDSILRDWHVPPIHVIENLQSRKQEVLDGQQRLAAIRDFVRGDFPVDGTIEPFESAIHSLDGTFYEELPEEWRRRFNQFTIRIFRIVDYQPSEPAELFFRLNQPSSLTGAEQRNAFFGPVREQIKELVEQLEVAGLNRRSLAFSNFRMAYDDVLSRTALAVERNTLAEKITSADLTALYRNDQPLAGRTLRLIDGAIILLAKGTRDTKLTLPKFNKATLFSWLVFLVRGILSNSLKPPFDDIQPFLNFFELSRIGEVDDIRADRVQRLRSRLFSIYEIRSSARVADVSSVILRDAVIWVVFDEFCQRAVDKEGRSLHLDRLYDAFDSAGKTLEEDLLARRLLERGWGDLE